MVSKIISKFTFLIMTLLAMQPDFALAGPSAFDKIVSKEADEETYFARIGEGFTSENASSGIEVAWRMFSAPDIPTICAKSERPVKLVTRKEPVALYIGEWFPLDRLIVLALDAADRPLPPVPIIIEVEMLDPPLLNLQSDMLAEAKVLPRRAGLFRFRARTLCIEAAGKFVEIRAQVSKP
jgi:hypothetical protein